MVLSGSFTDSTGAYVFCNWKGVQNIDEGLTYKLLSKKRNRRIEKVCKHINYFYELIESYVRFTLPYF